MSIREALYEISYANLLLYSSVFPDYHSEGEKYKEPKITDKSPEYNRISEAIFNDRL